jgi:hypothetical protein
LLRHFVPHNDYPSVIASDSAICGLAIYKNNEIASPAKMRDRNDNIIESLRTRHGVAIPQFAGSRFENLSCPAIGGIFQ